MWRHAGVSRASYVALALNSLKKVPSINENAMETHLAICSVSCAMMPNSLCDKTIALSTPYLVLSRKQQRVRRRNHRG